MPDQVVNGLPEEQGLQAQNYMRPQIIKIIESTKWAAGLSLKEIETLSLYVHVYKADKDTVIVREGRREAYLCLLVEGQVSIMKEGARAEKKRIGGSGAGYTFGEMSLIDGEPRSASVVADEPSTLVVLTGEGFSRLSLEVPRLAFKVLMKISKLISQRLRQTSGALVEHIGG